MIVTAIDPQLEQPKRFKRAMSGNCVKPSSCMLAHETLVAQWQLVREKTAPVTPSDFRSAMEGRRNDAVMARVRIQLPRCYHWTEVVVKSLLSIVNERTIRCNLCRLDANGDPRRCSAAAIASGADHAIRRYKPVPTEEQGISDLGLANQDMKIHIFVARTRRNRRSRFKG